MRAVGIDFGTTNSAIAVADGGEVRLARFDDAALKVFRSILFFQRPDAGQPPRPTAGPGAIEQYIDDNDGRLIQSLKSFLTSTSFRSTDIFGRQYTLEQLLAYYLRSLRARAEETLGPLGDHAVVGRPVRYAGDGPKCSEAAALKRMNSALAEAGFTSVEFIYEPVGAAYEYDATLDHDEVVMVADFGGGTSDFCLLHVGPDARADRRAAILGTDGEAVAGDVFDGRIVRHVVAPKLGQGTRYQASPANTMEVPRWLFAHLERWHLLSFLKARKTMQLLQQVAQDALDPGPVRALLEVVRGDLGFHLFRAVERVKVELSSAEVATLRFQEGGVDIVQPVKRADFEAWIEPDVARIAGAVDRLLDKTGADARDVDRVFMTGGTSLVPAVRRAFDERFGAGRVVLGDRFTSVAAGLARVCGDDAQTR